MYLSGMRNLNLNECSTKSGDADWLAHFIVLHI
jgi:hypothetical protein